MRDISDSLLDVLIATVGVSEYLQYLQMLRLKFSQMILLKGPNMYHLGTFVFKIKKAAALQTGCEVLWVTGWNMLTQEEGKNQFYFRICVGSNSRREFSKWFIAIVFKILSISGLCVVCSDYISTDYRFFLLLMLCIYLIFDYVILILFCQATGLFKTSRNFYFTGIGDI